jgi:hypothetical protein
VKVTLAVHPRFGEELPVRRTYGRYAVWVETPEERLLRVPLAWTTLRPRADPLAVEGRTVRLAPEALRELAAWVATRTTDAEAHERKDGQEVGHFDKHMENSDPDGALSDEPAGRHAEDGVADARDGERASSATGRDSAAAVVGQAGPPGAHATQRERGTR